MTIEQTRQLGIEFERRVQTMIPETEFQAKLDTETIYSFLNQYQDKFVHDIYKQIDQVPSPSKLSTYVETILQGLLAHQVTSVTPSNNRYSVELPIDFGLYLNSSTHAVRTYSLKNTTANEGPDGYIPNELMSQHLANEYIERPQDSMRILRKPIAYLTNNRMITVICDRYTTPDLFQMSYYRVPDYMNLMTSTACELPMEAFEDLVSGAVDLYVQYVAGAEARKRQIAESQKQQEDKK